MERWFNSLPVDLTYPDVQIGLRFVRERLLPIGARAFRTEIEIFGEEEDIAGSVDLTVILPCGELYIVDWKRSEKLSDRMTGFAKMKEPLNNLEMCSGCSYALQLGCYKYVIEKYYDMKVKGIALVSLHPDNYFFTPVPYLKKEVDYIMKRRRVYNDARKRLAHLYPEYVCPLSNRLAEDAIKDDLGNIYWKKAAIMNDIKGNECVETKNKINALLKSEMVLENPKGLVPWRMQYTGPKEDMFAYSK
jgi:hypothetical protein